MTETFFIVPAITRSPWILTGVMLVLVTGILALLVASVRGATSTRFELSDAGLRIRRDLYGRLIATSAVRGGSARLVDLGAEPDLTSRIRTMGTALPGYRAGWFRLRNGRRGLLHLTDQTRRSHPDDGGVRRADQPAGSGTLPRATAGGRTGAVEGRPSAQHPTGQTS